MLLGKLFPPSPVLHIYYSSSPFLFLSLKCRLWSEKDRRSNNPVMKSQYVLELPLVCVDCVSFSFFLGILYGTMTLELGGQITVACEKTGYSAQLEFKLKVWLCLLDSIHLLHSGWLHSFVGVIVLRFLKSFRDLIPLGLFFLINKGFSRDFSQCLTPTNPTSLPRPEKPPILYTTIHMLRYPIMT